MSEQIIMYPERCRACRRCEVACIAARHNLSFKDATKRKKEFGARLTVVKTDSYKTTVRCHQCNPAPCCHICPTGALQQGADGIIHMSPELCIACEMCIDACPYGAVHIDTVELPVAKVEDDPHDVELTQPRRIAVRCDLCRDWRKENNKACTACMEACPAHAMALQLDDGTLVTPPKPERKVAPKPAAKPAVQPAGDAAATPA